MEDVLNVSNLSDDNEIFRGYAIMIKLYNALKFITMLFFIQILLTFNLGVAFLKSVSIVVFEAKILCVQMFRYYTVAHTALIQMFVLEKSE